MRTNVLVLTILATLLALVFLVPMVYTLVSSLKSKAAILEFPIRWIPREIELSNFVIPFTKRNFDTYFLNSILAATTVTLCSLFISSMGGYSLAKFQFRGRNTLFLSVLLTLMLPVEVTMVPLALVTHFLKMINTWWGLIVPVIISPLGIFWMRQFLVTLPSDYINAGRIDGLGEFQIYLRIILPLSRPALGALLIFSFMMNWNSLIWPLIVAMRESLWTIPVALMIFVSEDDTLWNELFATSVLAVMPTLVIFLVLRGNLIKGMTVGGIKG